MVVVSDTSPIRALQAIDRIDLLGHLYGEVVVPPSMVAELAVPGAKVEPVRVEEHSNFRVRAPQDAPRVAWMRQTLGAGEAEAIVLALEIRASVVLVDDLRARRQAVALGLTTAGVLSVLVEAKKRNQVGRVDELLDQLDARIQFRVAPRLRTRVLRDAGEIA